MRKKYGDTLMTQEKIDRINELARKAKSVGLTPEEIVERDKLRREYIDAFKNNIRSQLGDPEEFKRELAKRKKS